MHTRKFKVMRPLSGFAPVSLQYNSGSVTPTPHVEVASTLRPTARLKLGGVSA